MSLAWVIGAAAVAILLGLSVYRARTAVPRLVYQQRAVPLLGDDQTQLPNIEVLYQQQPIARLTKTYLVVWNAGRLIRGSDLSTEDPLRFEVFGDAQILTAQIARASKDVNISVSASGNAKNAAAIAFDVLGPGEGTVLEILHTSSDRFGVVRGAISGMPRGPQDRGRVRHPFNPLPSQVPSSFKAIGNLAFTLIFAIGALLVVLSAFGSYLVPVLGPHVGPAMAVIEGVSDIIYASFAFIVLAQTRRRFPQDLAVPELIE